jgi:hypothetical protein
MSGIAATLINGKRLFTVPPIWIAKKSRSNTRMNGKVQEWKSLCQRSWHSQFIRKAELIEARSCQPWTVLRWIACLFTGDRFITNLVLHCGMTWLIAILNKSLANSTVRMTPNLEASWNAFAQAVQVLTALLGGWKNALSMGTSHIQEWCSSHGASTKQSGVCSLPESGPRGN